MVLVPHTMWTLFKHHECGNEYDPPHSIRRSLSLGRRIDLRSTYVDVSVSLFIGCALALCFGYVVGYFINPIGRETWASEWTSILVMAATHGLSHGLYLFFLGFTAIALAYFKSREGQAE